MTNALLAQVQAAKEAGAIKDQSVAETGFKRTITPAGVTTARFVGYVEIGDQPQDPWQGKAKDDAPMVRLTWELNGPKYLRNIAKEGEPENIIPYRITEEIKLSQNNKATYFKLFQKMRGDRDSIKHMTEMLGEGFIITIKHENGKKDPTKKYAKMRTQTDGWMIAPPIETSAATGETKQVPVPEIIGEISLLMQDFPTMEQWNSIFIDGTYKRTVDGSEVEISKNFVQFKCIQSSGFKGSPLEAMLNDNGGVEALLSAAKASSDAYASSQPDTEEKPPAAAPTTQKEETPPQPAPTASEETPPSSAPEASPETEEKEEENALAALGLA